MSVSAAGGGASTVVWVEAEELRRFAGESARGAGVPEEQVELLVGGLVGATLRGIDAHGVYRLPHYMRGMRAGDLNPAPRPRILRARGAVALLDGDNGLGIVIGRLAMERAIVQAREHGVGLVAVRHSNHSGMLAAHVMRAAEQAMIGQFTSNAPALMAPAGGNQAVLSNGPCAWAIPRSNQPPIVFDAAWSAASRSKIRLAAREGRSIPAIWAVGPNGEETTDPTVALEGTLMPAAGHKGYGAVLVNDILTGALTGAQMSFEMSNAALAAAATAMDSWEAGHLATAIDVTAFGRREEFDARVESLIEALRAAAPSPELEVLLPGEPEWRVQCERLEHGVPMSPQVVEDLDDFAAEFGIMPLERADG